MAQSLADMRQQFQLVFRRQLYDECFYLFEGHLDFSDDRLSHLLKHVSKQTYWDKIEHDLNARCIEVHDLPTEVIRCDATTVSGDHAVTEAGLFQFGQSKDDSTRPQIKMMLWALDPLGMPLAVEVLAALTPPRGRGKRQITDEAPLVEAISTVLSTQPPRPFFLLHSL